MSWELSAIDSNYTCCCAKSVRLTLSCSVVADYCPMLLSPKNGQVRLSRGRQYKIWAAFSCVDGYDIEGLRYRQCGLEKTWTEGEETTCSRKMIMDKSDRTMA